VLSKARVAFVDRKTNRQSANFETSQLTIQQRLLSGKQISHKNLQIPKFFFGYHLTGNEKPENRYTASNIKEAHVQKYSATTLGKTQYRRENLFLKRLNISL
jgi:hypothetical protein